MYNSEPSLNSECISEETTAGKSFSYSMRDVPGDSFKYWGQQGWICPKCEAVLSPWTSECPHCRPSSNEITTSPNTSPTAADDYITYINTLAKTYSVGKTDFASTHAEPNPNITAQF